MNRIVQAISPTVILAAILTSGCGAWVGSASLPIPEITATCSDCARVYGEISAAGRVERLVDELYVENDAVVRTDTGVEISGPTLALNTRNGVFVLNSMRGRILPRRVEVEIPRGTLLNIESKGPAHGDERGYRMTGGASLTIKGATVRANTIEIRYL